MAETEIPKTYDPKEVEARCYADWEKAGYFTAPKTGSNPFCIVIPPPNVTGSLHMGHALNNTLQDILTRWHRMRGDATLWMPGTDHAGIATQNVVERELLKKEKMRRQQVGREALIDRIWKWKEQYGDRIIQQLKAIGSSCDWSRTRFTMDEGLSRAVRENFVRLYNDKLIYRGKYIVNWCPRCQTALADDEVEHEEKKSHLWHIRYPYVDNPKDGIVVATTRPETLLGDTAVAVNPKDDRYKNVIGKQVTLPETGRLIPIVGDDFVDAAFGSGAVKVTPAHDPNDFQIGQRHNLPQLNIMNPDATIADTAPEKYRGLKREDCRNQLLQDLTDHGYLVKTEDHTHSVGHCYRCHTVVEPWLSDQWFVKMQPLAKLAIEATKSGKVNFHPARWTEFYLSWLENVRDWCISRQIWWGHRIPVWYCRGTDKGHCKVECREPIVSLTDPKACPHCGSKDLEQDPDVLDTWFSSALWPFSTLGWPEKTDELTTYYPTSVLVTDRGIIFFWVARMVMMGMYHLKQEPFKDVYINGTVLDKFGRKMSKSHPDTCIDPMDIVAKYGADAMRFALTQLTTEGQDITLDEQKFEMGRNFCNKIWNAARFIQMQGVAPSAAGSELSLADRWILNRLHHATQRMTTALEQFAFDDIAKALYDFFWRDYCDWYVEAIKPILMGPDSSAKQTTLYTMRHVFTTALQLLHPVMPFISEDLWHAMGGQGAVIVSRFPNVSGTAPYETDAREFELVKLVVAGIRNVRGEYQGSPAQKVPAVFKSTSDERNILEAQSEYVQRLGGLETWAAVDTSATFDATTAVAVVSQTIELGFPGMVDPVKERARLTKSIEAMKKMVASVEGKLSNKGFVDRAPKEIVAQEQARLEQNRAELQKLSEALGRLTPSP